MKHPLLMGRIFNTPGLIEEGKAMEIATAIKPYLLGEAPLPAPKAQGGGDEESEGSYQPYLLSDGGVAVINICGTLVQRSSWVDAWSGLMSYEAIRAKVEAALEDPAALGLLLEMDTHGGEVAGCFGLAKFLTEAAGEKPLWAIANEKAYSAGYLLACGADRLFLPASAGVGSIGVMALHLDQSKADKEAGLKYTAIYKGARKNDGNPHEPLTSEARTHLEERLNELYELFVEHVATARGLDPDAVAATEAGCFSGRPAVDMGLADGVMEFDQVLTEFENHLAKQRTGGAIITAPVMETQQKGDDMLRSKKEKETAAAPPDPAAEMDQAALDEALAAAKAEGVSEASARICGILESPEAEGKTKTALQLAKTGMGVDEAKTVLATVPVEAAKTQGGDEFSRAMAKVENPDIDPDGDLAAVKAGDDPNMLAKRMKAAQEGAM